MRCRRRRSSCARTAGKSRERPPTRSAISSATPSSATAAPYTIEIAHPRLGAAVAVCALGESIYLGTLRLSAAESEPRRRRSAILQPRRPQHPGESTNGDIQDSHAGRHRGHRGGADRAAARRHRTARTTRSRARRSARPTRSRSCSCPNGDSAAPAQEVTYRELLRKVTQAANAFHALGVGPTDVVSYMLPNLLETHYTIWGGEAAGIVNAVNPLLESDHIAHILNAVETKVLVTLGPTLGAALWEKVDAVRRACAEPARGAGRRRGTSHSRDDVLPFAAELDRQPADRLVERPPHRAPRHRLVLPHRRHDGTAEGRAHTHFNELADAWSAGVMLDLSEQRHAALRAAAVPRQRRRRHRHHAVHGRRQSRAAGRRGLSLEDGDHALLAQRRALPRQLLLGGADDLLDAARRPDRRRRRVVAALRDLRRGARCRRSSSASSRTRPASRSSRATGSPRERV